MEAERLGRVEEELVAFHAGFAPLFGRREAQERSEQYLRGLLVQKEERRSAENLAEAVEGANARALQRFLSESGWDDAALIERVQGYLGQRLSDAAGVFILDETGFPKQGKKSVGVARMYTGTLGKRANCQIGVFLSYTSPKGHATVDRRLYLPEQWTDDPARCRAAGVPEGVTFQTKPQLGLSMLRQARAWGHLAGQWVTGDEVYGNSTPLRDALRQEGWSYVLEVSCDTPVFLQKPRLEIPPHRGRGRVPQKPRRVAGEPAPCTVAEVAAGLEESAWTLLKVAEGSQGPRIYRFAHVRLWESRGGLPGPETWLLLRTNPDGSELKYYLSNAPRSATLERLGEVAALRWTVEVEFEFLKGEAGLDEYEVRSWRGWHHHTALVLLAEAFLLTLEQAWGEKAAPDHARAGRLRGPAPPAAPSLEHRGPARLAPANR